MTSGAPRQPLAGAVREFAVLARKPTAEPAARQLVAENGGSPGTLRW